MGQSSLNDFNTDLKFSHEAENYPFWEECYRKFFPTFSIMVSHRKNGYWQKAGVDRSIILENSKQILVDEKIRRKDYGDIALEIWSDVENKKEGWIRKPLMADYIAYAFLQSKKCYLFPVVQLQYAWKNNSENWSKFFGLKEARNNNYTTVFCPVPMKDLFIEIGKCLRCDFS